MTSSLFGVSSSGQLVYTNWAVPTNMSRTSGFQYGGCTSHHCSVTSGLSGPRKGSKAAPDAEGRTMKCKWGPVDEPELATLPRTSPAAMNDLSGFVVTLPLRMCQ